MLRKLSSLGIVLSFLICLPVLSFAQGGGTLKGTVTLGESGKPVHGALVTILQLKKTTTSDENGAYEFQGVPSGRYDVVAHLDRVNDVVQTVDMTSGGTVNADFLIQISGVSEQVTVTATGSEQATSSSIQSVNVIGSIELARRNTVSLGEALDGELGVAKRSFGPATARPVIRGFDGDRVLVLQDGDRIGALGFQSGDHTEPVDILSLDRVEVVKGPSTLLYGSSAVGGVVNAVSGHESPHKGINGYVTGIGSTNNWQGGGGAGIEYGTQNWLFFGNGSAQKANDYNTPIGRVVNSYSREGAFSGGVGYFKGKGFFRGEYTFDKRRYGIPVDTTEEDPEVVYLNPRRHSVNFAGGFRDAKSFIQSARFAVQYNNYRHSEIDGFTNLPNTIFKNNTFNYTGTFEQQKRGKLSGSFGFWGMHRDYDSIGEEALAPPTKQNSFAVFGVETLDLDRAVVQFGGRVETNRYNPSFTDARGDLPKRNFTGFSGAVGLRVPVWKGGSIVSNYSHSYRAPALEELYNFGPHPGNAAFEVGDPNLGRELNNGIDAGFRQVSERFRFEVNGFLYNIKNFIFLAPTGEEEDDLEVFNYEQGKAHFRGVEARFDVALHRSLWLNLGSDYVRAELTAANTPLPRIPPFRGRVGLEFRYKGLTLNPEAVMAKDQDRVFPTEDRTAGYTVFNLAGSYLIPRDHYAHIISFDAFNLGDRLYFNHLSFIKDFAPEIGQGVRVTYTLRFF